MCKCSEVNKLLRNVDKDHEPCNEIFKKSLETLSRSYDDMLSTDGCIRDLARTEKRLFPSQHVSFA